MNGITDLFLTKLDVLSGLDTVPACVAYQIDGTRTDELPSNARIRRLSLARCSDTG